jgi:hypothetical protein
MKTDVIAPVNEHGLARIIVPGVGHKFTGHVDIFCFHCTPSLLFIGVIHNADGCCVVAVHRWVALKIIPSWQFINNAPRSALAADTTTHHKLEHNI